MLTHVTIGEYTIRNAGPEDVHELEELQQLCFPTLASHELLTAAHFLNHINVFREGQWVITLDERVIASSGTLRVNYPAADHKFLEITDQLWITNTHDPGGEWLYQFDMGVRPAHRGKKLSTHLYNVQQNLVAQLGMKGQVTVGMTIGYDQYREKLTIAEYCEKLKEGEILDPTVTPQRRAGFQWVGPIFDYVEDPTAGNCGIMLVWPLWAEQ